MGDYQPYVPVCLDILDPNNEVPDWDLNTKPSPEDTAEDQFKGNKRIAENSPEGSLARKRKPENYVNDWQIAEFLEAYINGTATAPNYTDSNWLENEVTTDYGQTDSIHNVENVNDNLV